jgi:hypothetical protein
MPVSACASTTTSRVGAYFVLVAHFAPGAHFAFVAHFAPGAHFALVPHFAAGAHFALVAHLAACAAHFAAVAAHLAAVAAHFAAASAAHFAAVAHLAGLPPAPRLTDSLLTSGIRSPPLKLSQFRARIRDMYCMKEIKVLRTYCQARSRATAPSANPQPSS